MSVTIIPATDAAARRAERLAGALEGAQVDASRPARDAVAAAWGRGDALVLVMAVGAAVRLVAAHLRDKHTDPPVVALDDAGRYAVAVAGGHHGGNDLAERVAAALGAQPVVTTASEAAGLPAVETLGAALGLTLDAAASRDLTAVAAALVEGAPVARWRAAPWPMGPVASPVADVESAQEAVAEGRPLLAVTDEVVEVPGPVAVYRPPSLVVGVGASRDCPPAELAAAVDAALADAGLSAGAVAAVATVEAKADEAAVTDLAAQRGWPLRLHAPGALAEITVPNPSAAVAAAVGTPSVAEAAALATAGGDADLVVAKRASERADGAPAMATVAVARRPARGRLLLVSTGPGAAELVPPAAREALAAADLVVGLDQYLDRVRGWLRPGAQTDASPIGREVDRAQTAVAAATAGRSVALLSGGDVGVYAMAAPALERVDERVEVAVVPGVTAASAAAALLGAPLGHDHCSISLSDLLTPWEVIRRRVKAAAEGDFVVCFYNPRSKGRHWQLGAALELLGEHRKPDTPVGMVTDAFRPTQHVEQATLAEFDPTRVDMLTIVVVGNSQSRLRPAHRGVASGAGPHQVMVTPRGYA